jgi:hypothetical protein
MKKHIGKGPDSIFNPTAPATPARATPPPAAAPPRITKKEAAAIRKAVVNSLGPSAKIPASKTAGGMEKVTLLIEAGQRAFLDDTLHALKRKGVRTNMSALVRELVQQLQNGQTHLPW